LDRWNSVSDVVIYKVIFYEDAERETDRDAELLDIIQEVKIKIPPRMAKYLSNRHFIETLTQKLIVAKLNMSGSASDNLTRLFRQLELDKNVLRMLNSSSWYKKALAIQQVGIMELDEYKEKLFDFIDHKRALIRVEAQNAILKFYGFEGLRFLDKASYPITEWQQIKLLDQLASLPTEHFTGIEVWLESGNDTIVLFALKLVKNYHRFELYDQVLECLKHENPKVRRQAILVLKDLPTEQTPSELIDIYTFETANNQLAILHALESVSMDTEIPFLRGLLDDQVNAIKIAAAKSLASLGPAGLEAIQSHPGAKEYPLRQILAQIIEEVA
jgi:hypothetical protein